jgi:imidazole glycerol phosphate synthase subunit HisF
LQVSKAVEALGAGEIMLNCINNDGKGQVRSRRNQ